MGHSGAGHMGMARMWGIKGATEQADPLTPLQVKPGTQRLGTTGVRAASGLSREPHI